MAPTVRPPEKNGQHPTTGELILAELRALRREQAALRQLFDEFAAAFLNARFPYGKPTDRWVRRG